MRFSVTGVVLAVFIGLILSLAGPVTYANNSDAEAGQADQQDPVKENRAKSENEEKAKSKKAKSKKAKNKKAKNKRVCKRVKVTGSRIPERVCRKESEWKRLQDEARENAERSYEGNSRNISGDS